MLLRTTVAAVALMATTAPLMAATFTVYTDRTAFEAAAGAGATTETFDGVAAETYFGDGGSAVVGDLTISADAFEDNFIDLPPVDGEVDGNGTTALHMFTNSTDDASISFATDVFSFGADFFNFNDGILRTEISILGETFTPDVTASGTLSFFGVISDMAFGAVTFAGVANDVFGVDNVTTNVSPVPVPASLPLLGGALLGAAAWGRRRKH